MKRQLLHQYGSFACGAALCLISASCGHEPSDTKAIAEAPSLAQRHVLADVSKGIPKVARCYPLSTERAIFKLFRVKSDDRNEWIRMAEGVADVCEGTRAWDDKWYYYTLPDDKVDNLLLVWRNIDSHAYGYVAIKNTPNLWLVYSNTGNGGPWHIKNDEQLKFSWTTDGRRIDIDVKNPRNVDGWTANDIMVSFGF
jgi:hypothetical protein